MIKVHKSSPAFQIPSGTYVARAYSMVHIGTTAFQWKGETVKSDKVRITFELPTELKVFKEGESEKPLVISGEYSLSFGKKSKLRPILESWRGKQFTDDEIENFDVTKLIGVPAMISIIQNEKGYAEIATVSKLPKGTECPPQVNQSVILDYDNWNQEVFEKLPEFIRNKMMTSDEYRTMKGEKVATVSEDDSLDASNIPF